MNNPDQNADYYTFHGCHKCKECSMENSVTTASATPKKTTSYCTKIRNFFAILFCCFWVKKAPPATPTLAESTDPNRSSTVPLTSRSLSAETDAENTPLNSTQTADSTAENRVTRPLNEKASLAAKHLKTALEALSENKSPAFIISVYEANWEMIASLGSDRRVCDASMRVDFFRIFIEEHLQDTNLKDRLKQAIKDESSETYHYLKLIIYISSTTHDFQTDNAARLFPAFDVFTNQLLEYLADDQELQSAINTIVNIDVHPDAERLKSFVNCLKDFSDLDTLTKKDEPKRPLLMQLRDRFRRLRE